MRTLAFLILCSCATASFAQDGQFSFASPAIPNASAIDKLYTCDSRNISPLLRWSGAPAGTRSFLIYVHDRDAPAKDWVHWIVYNIPPELSGLDENQGKREDLLVGGMQGVNDFNLSRYNGPCPPSGTHRYLFELFALDIVLRPEERIVTWPILKRLIEGHVIGHAKFEANYQRAAKK